MPVVVPTLTSGGERLPATVLVRSIEVRREVGRVPEATVEVVDGSRASRLWSLSNQSFFAPGRLVRIALRTEGATEDTPVFEGLVLRHTLESPADGVPTLRVELKDSAFKLTRTRRTRVFRDRTDAEVLRQVLGSAAETIRGEGPRHAELVQLHATDWDFLVLRAEALGLGLDAHLGKVSAVPLALSTPRRALDHGLDDVSELLLEIDGEHQWAAVQGVAWDPTTLAPTAPELATEPDVRVGNLDARSIATALGAEEETLVHAGPLEPGELAAWANARLTRARLALLRGRAVVAGDAGLAPLDTVEIRGVGEKVDGRAIVSGVTQHVDDDGWWTELELGLSAEPFARRPDLVEPPAAGLLPPSRDLQLAVVGAFEEDPTGEARVKVRLATLTDAQGDVWARLARPDAGPSRGFSFRPEPGDEVVVGFLDGDPRQAIVLGALYGGRSAPPSPPTEANHTRSIVSRAGTRIVFDDARPSVTIETAPDGAAGGRVVIDEKDQVIRIEDPHGNLLVLDRDGIRVQSARDLTLEAKNAVVIKGATVDVQ